MVTLRISRVALALYFTRVAAPISISLFCNCNRVRIRSATKARIDHGISPSKFYNGALRIGKFF